MCDDAVRMVMPVMRMISWDMKRYAGVLSRQVCYRYAIQTVMEELRCVLKVSADTWEIGHKYE